MDLWELLFLVWPVALVMLVVSGIAYGIDFRHQTRWALVFCVSLAILAVDLVLFVMLSLYLS